MMFPCSMVQLPIKTHCTTSRSLKPHAASDASDATTEHLQFAHVLARTQSAMPRRRTTNTPPPLVQITRKENTVPGVAVPLSTCTFGGKVRRPLESLQPMLSLVNTAQVTRPAPMRNLGQASHSFPAVHLYCFEPMPKKLGYKLLLLLCRCSSSSSSWLGWERSSLLLASSLCVVVDTGVEACPSTYHV
eukprot:6418949-Amphidinium_carterae.1